MQEDSLETTMCLLPDHNPPMNHNRRRGSQEEVEILLLLLLLSLLPYSISKPVLEDKLLPRCPIPLDVLQAEEDSTYTLILSHEAWNLSLGYVPGVVYQGWVKRSVPTVNNTLRTYILRAIISEHNNESSNESHGEQVDLTLPEGVTYSRCAFSPSSSIPLPTHLLEDADNRPGAGMSDAVVMQTTDDLMFNWTTPSSLGCIRFVAYIMEESETWSSVSHTICERKGCYRYITSSYGTLTSGEEDMYGNNQDCVTVLKVPTQYIMYLQFERLEIEQFRDKSGECFDYVSIASSEEAVSSPARQICGEFSGEQLKNLTFRSQSNFMVVHFVTDTKIASSGYSAVFYSLPTSGCNAVYKNTTGVLQAPSHMGKYFPNLDCTYTIAMPKNYRIILSLEYHLQDKTTSNLCIDYLTIETSQLGEEKETLCGLGKRQLTSSLNWMRVRFHSDYLIQKRGFRAVYSGYKSCENVTYMGDNGTISSMGYPDAYLNNQICFITIQAPPGSNQVIELQFDLLQTEANTTSYLSGLKCDADYVIIDDGVTLHRRCGDWRPRLEQLHFRSAGEQLVLKFVTNSAQTGLGFVARWLAVANDSDATHCQGGWVNFGSSCYKVMTPLRSWEEAEQECEFEGGQLATVRSSSVDDFLQGLVKDSLNDSKDLAVWIGATDKEYEADFFWPDGSSVQFTDWFPGWPQYDFYNRQPSDDGLGDNQDCIEMRTHFRFPSKGIGNASGFFWNDRDCRTLNSFICERLRPGGLVPLPRVPYVCSVALAVDPTRPVGFYTSPGFPSNYDDRTNCSATITAPKGRLIQVKFLSFHLEDSDSCEYDSLTLSSALDNTTIANVTRCGDWNDRLKLLRYVSFSNTLHLKFVADHSRHFPGFKLKYSMVSESALCPGPSWLLEGDKCYLPVRAPFHNGRDAQHTCLMHGARLALGPSPLEQVLITNLLEKHTGNGTFLLGAIRTNATSDWTKLDGTRIDSSLLLPLDSDPESVIRDGETACLAVTVGKGSPRYIISNCDRELSFVCQYGLIGPHPRLEEAIDAAPSSQVTSLTSPGYPTKPYPTNIHISWLVRSPSMGDLLLFTIQGLDLESHPNCLYDYLQITDPLSGTQTRFCGQETLITHSVSGGLATLEFVSDYKTTGRGFNITWRSFPKEETANWSIVIPLEEVKNQHNDTKPWASAGRVLESPNYPISYLNDLDYWVTIKAPEQFTIWLELLDLHLSSSESMCSDHLSIFMDEGHSEQIRLCGELTADELFNAKYLSRDNYTALHFVTDGRGNAPGYRIAFRAVPREGFTFSATRRLSTNSTGRLVTPNHPYTYPPYLNYTLTLEATLGSLLQLTISSLQLTNTSRDCQNQNGDLLEITDPYAAEGGRKVLARMCGGSQKSMARLPLVLTSNFHYLRLRFTTGDFSWLDQDAAGYVIEYKLLPDIFFLNKSLTDRPIPLGSCVFSPCQNGGQCVITEDGTSACDCKGHYTGMVCLWTHCDRSPCANGGTCKNVEDGYNCTCVPGYGGPACQVNMEKCRVTRCSKQGMCIIGHDGQPTECACENNYVGQSCELLRSTQFKSSSSRLLAEPFWIGIIVVIGVLALTGLVVLVRRKCLKNIEVDCCVCGCCDLSDHDDIKQSDKLSLHNANGISYIYGNLSDGRTPYQSGEASRSSSPERHYGLPCSRVYQEDDNEMTYSSYSHSLGAAAAVIVPNTADIINATSTTNSYNQTHLTAIDEEPSDMTSHLHLQDGTVVTSEEEDSTQNTIEPGVAIIHCDVDGRRVGRSGETTIKRSHSSKGRITPQSVDSSQSSSDIYLNFKSPSLDERRRGSNGLHCWHSSENDDNNGDDHGLREGSILFQPRNNDSKEFRHHVIDTQKQEIYKREANQQEQGQESITENQNKRSRSAQRREQFVSSVRRARDQNRSANDPSSIRHFAETHSGCSCCTGTSYESDSHASYHSHHREPMTHSSDVPESRRCSRCSHDMSHDVGEVLKHRRRSSGYDSSQRPHGHHHRHRHRDHVRSTVSSSESHRHKSHSPRHHRRARYQKQSTVDMWSVSVDIPPDEEIRSLSMGSLSRNNSHRSTKSDQTGRRKRHRRKDSPEGQREHHDYRHQRTSSSRRRRHHRSANAINDYHYSERERHERNHSHRDARRHRDSHHCNHRKHHHHQLPDGSQRDKSKRSHKKLEATLSDSASYQKVKVWQETKRASSLKTRHSPNSSSDSIEIKPYFQGQQRNRRNSDRDSGSPDKSVDPTLGKGCQFIQQLHVAKHHQPDRPSVQTMDDFDSAKGSSIMNSIDYLKVPSFDNVFPSDPESAIGTSSECVSSTSGVSSNNEQRHPSGEDEAEQFHYRRLPMPIKLNRQTPLGSHASVDIDTPSKDVSVLNLFPHYQISQNGNPNHLSMIPLTTMHSDNSLVDYGNGAHATEAAFDRPSPKHPLQDSAYQSKEQSTEKNISRPSSNVVSPTQVVSMSDVYFQVNPKCISAGNEDQRITNQLELAARKLALIKHVEDHSAVVETADCVEQMHQRSASSMHDSDTSISQKDGQKFIKGRKMWPSRILSIIVDEGESDQLDNTPGSCSRSPKVIRRTSEEHIPANSTLKGTVCCTNIPDDPDQKGATAVSSSSRYLDDRASLGVTQIQTDTPLKAASPNRVRQRKMSEYIAPESSFGNINHASETSFGVTCHSGSSPSSQSLTNTPDTVRSSLEVAEVLDSPGSSFSGHEEHEKNSIYEEQDISTNDSYKLEFGYDEEVTGSAPCPEGPMNVLKSAPGDKLGNGAIQHGKSSLTSSNLNHKCTPIPIPSRNGMLHNGPSINLNFVRESASEDQTKIDHSTTGYCELMPNHLDSSSMSDDCLSSGHPNRGIQDGCQNTHQMAPPRPGVPQIELNDRYIHENVIHVPHVGTVVLDMVSEV